MTIGFISLHALTSENISIIAPILKSTTDNIISNHKLGVPYQHVDFGNASVFGDNNIYLSKENSKFNLFDPYVAQIAIIDEIIKRSDKLMYVIPDQSHLTPLVLFLILKSKKPYSFIISNKSQSKEMTLRLFQSIDRDELKKQYEWIYGKEKPKKVYDTSKLLQTPSGATLRPYQQQMVDFAVENKRVGLLVDMGLGKTLATLAAIDTLVKSNKLDTTKPILIVAPILVAIDTWSREADKWGYDVDVKINIKLTPKKRKVLLESLLVPQEKLTFLTTNPEQLSQIYTFFHDHGIQNPFQMIIVDELSLFKSPTSNRFLTLSRNSQNVEYFFGLTGTPAPNNLLDIWSQMILISPRNKQEFGSDFFIYRNKFFMPDKIGYMDGKIYSWKLKPNADKEIYHRMSKTAISMQSEGLIDLPGIVYKNEYVTLPKKAQQKYDELAEATYQDLLNVLDLSLDQSNLQINNPAVLKGKLAQLATGAVYEDKNIIPLDDFSISSPYTVFHDAKLEKLKEIANTATSPLLVFISFKSDLDRLGKYIDYVYMDTKTGNIQEIITAWNKGEIPILVLNPASVSHGLNIQDGGHTIIWLSPIWNNEQYGQANKRLYRSGQKNTVSVIHILAKGTVDEEIMDSLAIKENNQSSLMKALDVADIHRKDTS